MDTEELVKELKIYFEKEHKTKLTNKEVKRITKFLASYVKVLKNTKA
jgi:hypothetical protein